ncbi:MAG TPA: NUDIX hydrolase [Streptosporangiaceae bacterium]|nr:NUDIX hydrolase [Streptosporangiaceae bacterium]
MTEPEEMEAAGVLLWRRTNSSTEVLLIHRPWWDDWSLPKGKRNLGEHILQVAVREVTEETGLRPVLGRRLRTVHYRVDGAPKHVHYWAAAAPVPTAPAPPRSGSGGFRGADLPPGQHGVPNKEVDRVEWLSLPQAREQLSYPHDVGVLNDFAQWPRETVPLILLRHASAGSKKDWRGDDALRPLDDRGRAAARVLAALLGCFAPRRVVSSATRRCIDTVAPYAARIGAAVEEKAAFAVPTPSQSSSSCRTSADDPASAMARIVADGVPAVVCVHRENIPVLLAAACEHLGAVPPADPSLPKGGFWVLQAGDGRLVGLERHDLSGVSGG